MGQAPHSLRLALGATGRCTLVLLTLVVTDAFRNSYAEAGGDPIDQDRAQFIIANLEFTLIHELSHALISELNIPVLGKEEDAADQIATMALLLGVPGHRHDTEIRREPYAERLRAVADAWRIEWELAQHGQMATPYWDNHSLDIQRFYSILCLMYGSDPEYFADLSQTMLLPHERAWSCEDEYPGAIKSANWLLQTFGSKRGAARKKMVGKIAVTYGPPTTEQERRILELVKHSGVIEEDAARAEGLFTLPNDIEITVIDCLGEADAYWREDLKQIIVCHELLERFDYLHALRSCVVLDHLSTNSRDAEEQIRRCLSAASAK